MYLVAGGWMTVEGLFIVGVGESTREALAAACPNNLGWERGTRAGNEAELRDTNNHL